MAIPLKDYFNSDSLSDISINIKEVYTSFESSLFIQKVFDDEWDSLEFKQRIEKITDIIFELFKFDYDFTLMVLHKLALKLDKQNYNENRLEYWFIPYFIEKYGKDKFHNSIDKIEDITKIATCEFVVRHYFISHQDEMLKKAYSWSRNYDFRVRRLASESCRPRLPWGIKLNIFIEKPELILPILENALNDSNDWVLKSVANNLNDISKDNPEFYLGILKKFIGKNTKLDKFLKHSARTLFKKADEEVLNIFGVRKNTSLKMNQLRLDDHKIKIGDNLSFSFNLANESTKEVLSRIEYKIYYLQGSNKHFAKVFKISEKNLMPNSTVIIKKNHSFREITTRRYYLGTHFLSIIINGNESERLSFSLYK